MFFSAIIGMTAFGVPQSATPIQSEYIAKLTATESNSESQFRLATWARKQGLNEAAEGHLRAAVYIDPKNARAQKALGRSEKSGVWESPTERKHRLALESKLLAGRMEWGKRLANAGIEGAVMVHAIDESGASAIEEFAAADRDRSLAAVHAIEQSTHNSATLSLVHFAVGSAFPEVRKAATRSLQERNPDDFLLSLLEYARPLRSERATVLGVGDVWYWQEGLAMFVALPSSSARLTLQRNGATPSELVPEMPVRHASAERLRENAVAALQTVTGLNIGPDFSEWRDSRVRRSNPRRQNPRR